MLLKTLDLKKFRCYLNRFKNKSKQNVYNPSKIIANVGVNGQ